MFGRAFELADGTIILPCEHCGSPFWPDTHTCPQGTKYILEVMNQIDRDKWKDL